jgi:hypothetical protein
MFGKDIELFPQKVKNVSIVCTLLFERWMERGF